MNPGINNRTNSNNSVSVKSAWSTNDNYMPLSLFFLHLGVLILQKEVAKTMYQKVEGKATKTTFTTFAMVE